jgi:hypothetical protein
VNRRGDLNGEALVANESSLLMPVSVLRLIASLPEQRRGSQTAIMVGMALWERGWITLQKTLAGELQTRPPCEPVARPVLLRT